MRSQARFSRGGVCELGDGGWRPAGMEHILQGRGRGVEVKAVVGPGGFLPVGCRKQPPCRVAGAKPGDQASWRAASLASSLASVRLVAGGWL